MTLTEFKAMWTSDGLMMVEEENRQVNGYRWLLFAITEPASTNDYGRHYGLLVVVDAEEKILAHNFRNISSGDTRPYRQQVIQWFEEHIAEGLIDKQGRPITTEVC